MAVSYLGTQPPALEIPDGICLCPGTQPAVGKGEISQVPYLLRLVLSTKAVIFYCHPNWKLRSRASQMAGATGAGNKYMSEIKRDTKDQIKTTT